jgi:hypothetical protein
MAGVPGQVWIFEMSATAIKIMLNLQIQWNSRLSITSIGISFPSEAIASTAGAAKISALQISHRRRSSGSLRQNSRASLPGFTQTNE